MMQKARNACLYFICVISFLFSSCSLNRNITQKAEKFLLSDTAIKTGHIGVCLFDPHKNKFCYTRNADKYFIPASNTKLFTLYAALKLLGDSLVGIKYTEQKDTVYIIPTGDPSYMHDDFSAQPVNDFLCSLKKPICFILPKYNFEKYGSGWAWDDYNTPYMAERNIFPAYGNSFTIDYQFSGDKNTLPQICLNPALKSSKINLQSDSSVKKNIFRRDISKNTIDVIYNNKADTIKSKIPFVTNGISTVIEILQQKIPLLVDSAKRSADFTDIKTIKSQSTDSVLKKMMYESDNFFAEQLLLMSSNEKLGYMSDRNFIDTLLKNELNDLPQKPKWIDGSGLSRYNLITPQAFVVLLNKMKNEFGLETLQNILPGGGQGTLKNYFISDSNYIFAKTGTLSGVSSLSGYIITKKGRLLIFSLIVNNYTSSSTAIKKAFEKFLVGIINED